MAESFPQSLDMEEGQKYFCFDCNQEVAINQDLRCPICFGGFIKKVTHNSEDSTREFDDTEDDETEDATENEYEDDDEWLEVEDEEPETIQQRIIRTMIDIENYYMLEDDVDVEDEIEDEDENEDEGNEVEDEELRIFRQQNILIRGEDQWETSIARFYHEVMGYPFPLSKEQIEAIPDILIRKEHFERNFQCTVCLEDFKLNEKVKNLPCDHFFHKECINPWLERQVTCPVCRKLIKIAKSNEDKSSEIPPPRETMDSVSENSARSSSQSSSYAVPLGFFYETYSRLNM